MLAFLQGFNAALNNKQLADCPFSVHTETASVADWVRGYLDCTLNVEEQFEKAFETVVESQLKQLDNPNDHVLPFIKDCGEPGSKDRIDMMILFYEEQMERPEDERESAFSNISLGELLNSFF